MKSHTVLVFILLILSACAAAPIPQQQEEDTPIPPPLMPLNASIKCYAAPSSASPLELAYLFRKTRTSFSLEKCQGHLASCQKQGLIERWTKGSGEETISCLAARGEFLDFSACLRNRMTVINSFYGQLIEMDATVDGERNIPLFCEKSVSNLMLPFPVTCTYRTSPFHDRLLEETFKENEEILKDKNWVGVPSKAAYELDLSVKPCELRKSCVELKVLRPQIKRNQLYSKSVTGDEFKPEKVRTLLIDLPSCPDFKKSFDPTTI